MLCAKGKEDYGDIKNPLKYNLKICSNLDLQSDLWIFRIQTRVFNVWVLTKATFSTLECFDRDENH